MLIPLGATVDHPGSKLPPSSRTFFSRWASCANC